MKTNNIFIDLSRLSDQTATEMRDFLYELVNAFETYVSMELVLYDTVDASSPQPKFTHKFC
jgi:hypothetical protein